MVYIVIFFLMITLFLAYEHTHQWSMSLLCIKAVKYWYTSAVIHNSWQEATHLMSKSDDPTLYLCVFLCKSLRKRSWFQLNIWNWLKQAPGGVSIQDTLPSLKKYFPAPFMNCEIYHDPSLSLLSLSLSLSISKWLYEYRHSAKSRVVNILLYVRTEIQ